jgi:FixJ family two-component response regulator
MIEVETGTDLLILDLEMPYSQGIDVLELLFERKPLLPVVIHTLLTDHAAHNAVKRAAAFLEKRGNNIDSLKDVVSSVLRNAYPERFAAASDNSNTREYSVELEESGTEKTHIE